MIEEVVDVRLTCDDCKRTRFVKTSRQSFVASFDAIKALLPIGWACKKKQNANDAECAFYSDFSGFETLCQFCSHK